MDKIAEIALGVAALILGAFGLHKISFERGYVHGVEDATQQIDVTLEDDDDA